MAKNVVLRPLPDSSAFQIVRSANAYVTVKITRLIAYAQHVELSGGSSILTFTFGHRLSDGIVGVQWNN